jgi:hypothetical protein
MPNESGQFQDTSTPRIGKNIAIITVLGERRIIFWASGHPAAVTPAATTAPVTSSLVARSSVDLSRSIDGTAPMPITGGTVAAAGSSSGETTECR